jgi:hypothetical protein
MIALSRGDALRPLGTSGLVQGITAADGCDVSLSPAALVATTVKVYETPLVSPVMVMVMGCVTGVFTVTGVVAGFEVMV